MCFLITPNFRNRPNVNPVLLETCATNSVNAEANSEPTRSPHSFLLVVRFRRSQFNDFITFAVFSMDFYRRCCCCYRATSVSDNRLELIHLLWCGIRERWFVRLFLFFIYLCFCYSYRNPTRRVCIKEGRQSECPDCKPLSKARAILN